MPGGVAEALDATRGEVVGVTNGEAAEAQKLFEGLEGIDILPAPAVAVAALLKAVAEGEVSAHDRCLLNITGGGMARLKEEHSINRVESDLTFAPGQDTRQLMEQVHELMEGP
jgi:cysteate synthase